MINLLRFLSQKCQKTLDPDGRHMWMTLRKKETWFFNNFLHDEWNLMMTTWWNDIKLSTFSTHFRIYFFMIESSVNPLNVKKEGRKDEVRVGGKNENCGSSPTTSSWLLLFSLFHVSYVCCHTEDYFYDDCELQEKQSKHLFGWKNLECNGIYFHHGCLPYNPSTWKKILPRSFPSYPSHPYSSFLFFLISSFSTYACYASTLPHT